MFMVAKSDPPSSDFRPDALPDINPGGRAEASAKDIAIRLAVLESLHWDLAINPGDVTVEASKGWVTLGGRVRRAFARHRAEWVAREVPGVIGIVNAIEIERASS